MDILSLEIQKSYRDSIEGLAKYVDSNQFNAGQLCAIRYGLECGLCVENYAKPEYTAEEMHKEFIRLRDSIKR